MKRTDLKKLYKNGLISSKPFEYIEINEKFKQYRRQGKSVSESVDAVSKLTNKSVRTIYRAIDAAKGINLT